MGRRIAWAEPEPMKRFKDAPELIVAKTHQFSVEKGEELAKGKAFGLYIYRDLRDVVVSKMRKENKTFQDIYQSYFIESLLYESRLWLRCKNLMVSRYEDVMADLPREVGRIAEFLGIQISRHQAVEIAAEYSIPKQRERIQQAVTGSMIVDPFFQNARYDPYSNLHDNHIAGGEIGGWRTRLTPWQIALVEQVAGDWLVEKGYNLAYPKFQRVLLGIQAAPLRYRRKFTKQE